MILTLILIGIAITLVATGVTLFVKGYTGYGRWDMSTRRHVCNLPDLYMWRHYRMTNGTIWRCRKCKTGWIKRGRSWENYRKKAEEELGL